MLFHTLTFAVFFAVVLALVGRLQTNSTRKLALLIGSYVFYMWWSPVFIFLILASTVVDYLVGLALGTVEHPTHRKALVVVSVCTQLGFLATFKYLGFFLTSINSVLNHVGYSIPIASHITLPVGISFYTFATLSYSIDVYRRQIAPTRSFLDFALFIAFFPHLVAGPIVRGAQLLPQFKVLRRLQFNSGIFFLILGGLAKKVLVADNLAPFVDGVFNQPSEWPSAVIWLATLAFYAQIYCDFSGYTDIAIGVARILGYELPQNFNKPYFAVNPSDFWRRWHITLSSWLRDYLYIPLGGSLRGTVRTYSNLALTMLLGGLWHGASWNFVLWGAWHGLLLILHRLYRSRSGDVGLWDRLGFPRIGTILSTAAMQYCILLSWILFRINDFDKMLIALRKFLVPDFAVNISGVGLGALSMFSTLTILIAFCCLHTLSYRLRGLAAYLATMRGMTVMWVCGVAGVMFFLLWPLSESPFIYFQF